MSAFCSHAYHPQRTTWSRSVDAALGLASLLKMPSIIFLEWGSIGGHKHTASRSVYHQVVFAHAGRTRVRLRSTGEVFSLVPPNCKAHNVVVGRTWVDTFGDYILLNATTGAKAEIYFEPCGWFGSGFHEVSCLLHDQNSTACMSCCWCCLWPAPDLVSAAYTLLHTNRCSRQTPQSHLYAAMTATGIQST